jgi:segregation and condensation protein A
VTHEVALEVFRGPIDLLLHLITRRRVDIYDVSLSTITDEYLTAIADVDRLDLESATGFLVIAATLVELKSARLLPAHSRSDLDGPLLEERDLLLARLVECATYREAGSWLRGRLALGDRYHGRAAAMEPDFLNLVPDVLRRVTTADLAAAAARLLSPKPQVELDISHLEPIRASVRSAIAELAGAIQHKGTASFSGLCEGAARIEVVVRFLALLELFKAGAVDLDQVDRWGDISVVWTGETSIDHVIAAAEEYELAPTGTGP